MEFLREQYQWVTREDPDNGIEPGNTSESETSKNDRGSNRSLQSEPVLQGGKHRGQSDRNPLAEQSARKKPRFLSNWKIYCEKT